jgi:hypothetical protein
MQSEQNKSIDKGGTVMGDERNKKQSETPESLGTKVEKPKKKIDFGKLAGNLDTSIPTEDVKAAGSKKTSGFFNKKSPLKMKYFK